jgi:hypothetical protein
MKKIILLAILLILPGVANANQFGSVRLNGSGSWYQFSSLNSFRCEHDNGLGVFIVSTQSREARFELEIDLPSLPQNEVDFLFRSYSSRLKLTVFNVGPSAESISTTSCTRFKIGPDPEFRDQLVIQFHCQGLRLRDGANPPVENATMDGEFLCQL